MGLPVLLIDKSEIIHKILSHCLHYFSAKVERFDSFEDSQSYFSGQKPEMVFVDWESIKGNSSVFDSIVEQIRPVPVVLLYRVKDHSVILTFSSGRSVHKIQKPLDPKQVRNLFKDLVPSIKDSPIHSFLKFPSGLKEEEELSSLQQPDQKEISSSPALKREQKQPSPSLPNSKRELKKEADSLRTGKIHQNKPSPSPKTAHLKAEEETKVVRTITRKLMNKRNIKIDEDTKNDFAPMAIKDSDSEKEFSVKDLELNEELIVKVLNKYKDTLEFQELVEKALKEQARQIVSHILQDLKEQKLKDFMKEPLKEFKDSRTFREMVNKQTFQYVNENLPLLIKEIVQQEIKKIIGD